jgi:hypothetical protein
VPPSFLRLAQFGLAWLILSTSSPKNSTCPSKSQPVPPFTLEILSPSIGDLLRAEVSANVRWGPEKWHPPSPPISADKDASLAGSALAPSSHFRACNQDHNVPAQGIDASAWVHTEPEAIPLGAGSNRGWLCRKPLALAMLAAIKLKAVAISLEFQKFESLSGCPTAGCEAKLVDEIEEFNYTTLTAAVSLH